VRGVSNSHEARKVIFASCSPPITYPLCGKYKTVVPNSHFEHLNEIRGKKRKRHVIEEVRNPTDTGNSGPVNVVVHPSTDDTIAPRLELRDHDGATVDSVKPAPRTPENCEDIRCVANLIFFISLAVR
jgi:hypothetical protein